MPGTKVTYIIAIASLCFLSLLFFQVKWLSHSKQMIESQFEQKVSMALCAAVDELSLCKGENCAVDSAGCSSPEAMNHALAVCTLQGKGRDTIVRSTIEAALAFYNVPLEFDYSVLRRGHQACNPESPYCCSLVPFNADNDQFLNVVFPGLRAYVLDKMWFMLVSSVLIVLFILFVFIWTIKALIDQRRISAHNVDFFNNMAHEFQTPLTSMQLARQQLVRKNPGLADNPYVNILEVESDKLRENLQRVLGLARLEGGRYQLKREHVDVHQLLNQVVGSMALMIQDRDATVRLDPSLRDIHVWGDPLHLAHAFRNLIDNSLKYSERKPDIKISMQQRDKGVVLVFEDNGIGISKPNQSIVFEKFRRLSPETREKGFGVGLSYVRMIMELHRGTIQLLSRVGAGSRFELFFPTR